MGGAFPSDLTHMTAIHRLGRHAMFCGQHNGHGNSLSRNCFHLNWHVTHLTSSLSEPAPCHWKRIAQTLQTLAVFLLLFSCSALHSCEIAHRTPQSRKACNAWPGSRKSFQDSGRQWHQMWLAIVGKSRHVNDIRYMILGQKCSKRFLPFTKK